MTNNTHRDEEGRAPFSRRRFIQISGAIFAASICPFAWGTQSMSKYKLQEVNAAALSANWGEPKVRGSGWLEWRLSAPSDWRVLESNPFDPVVTDMQVEFLGPDGRSLRATAFWIEDSNGTGWAVRLLPHVTGKWSAASVASFGGDTPVPVGKGFSFEVSKVPGHQKVGIDPDYPGYFAFEDGSPYVPIGLNVAWATGSTLGDYRRWFKKLSANGGNFARIWMASWSFGLEWKDTGLGNYSARLDRAANLDKVLEMAEEYGIRIMLCLVNHGAFTRKNDSEWKDNPYNKANGGPLEEPDEFVTNDRARDLFARRVRYIAARWSHSPALHSWEWWNEVNWTPIDDDDLLPWIHEMNRVLDRHDPYRRLCTTSWADRGPAKAWAMQELDFAQQHDYTGTDLSLRYASQYREFREEVRVKPLLPGELGYATSYDAGDNRPFNWDAVHLHNGLWAPVFRGYAGTGMYWWWDLMVDPLQMWPAYKGIARFVEAVQEQSRIAAHRPHPAKLVGGAASALALVSKSSVLLWVRSELHDVSALQEAYSEAGSPEGKWTPDWKPVKKAKVKCRGLHAANGVARVRWMDAQTGEWLADAPGLCEIQSGMLTVDCPVFERDVAAIVDLEHVRG